MVDFILGLALAAMIVRGWSRGFVREILDLVGLVAGLWIAFRLSAPFGEFLSDSFGVSPEVARIGGGIALFILFGASMSVAAHYLSRVMNLPGLSMVNRVGGAAVALGWGVAIIFLVVSLLSVVSVSDSWDEQIEESNVIRLIAGEDAVPRRMIESLVGDNVMATVAAIQDIFGHNRAVPEGSEVLSIPPAASDALVQNRGEAERVLEQINEHRVGLDLGAVQLVSPMTEVAESLAVDMYRSGEIRKLGDCQFTLSAVGYNVVSCDSGVALAGTASGALAGILDSEEGREALSSIDADRIGVSVVEGPTGRLLVLILGR